MPDNGAKPQVKAPVETPRERPVTTDPVWHLLFDRLDAQDENIKLIGDNTVVIASEQDRLKQHVNEERDDIIALIETKVGEGEVLQDLWNNFKKNRPAQAVVAAVVTAMTPVIAFNWGAFLESIKAAF